MRHQRASALNRPSFSSYDSYVRAEWRLFDASPHRELSAREAVAGMPVSRVLDIGCGAGQELRPFVHDPGTLGVGLDISPEVGHAGRELFRREQPSGRVAFMRGAAERLPLATGSVDVVVCRLALPYTDNRAALAEMARVLRPGGALLLKFHHARFYWRELVGGLARGRVKTVVHACRVLCAGLVYHTSGFQPRGRFLGSESFQTWWLLRRTLARSGLQIEGQLMDSNPATPSLIIRSGHAADDPAASRPPGKVMRR